MDLVCILYALRALAGRTSHPDLVLPGRSGSIPASEVAGADRG